MNRKRTYAPLLLIMLLQSLLLLRVLVPVVHTMLHGVNDVGIQISTALCDISEEAASSEEPQKSGSAVQFSLADMLTSGQTGVHLQLPALISAKVFPAHTASLPVIALPGSTPPPQC